MGRKKSNAELVKLGQEIAEVLGQYRNGITLDRLAQIVGRSRPQIGRDLEIVEALGFELKQWREGTGATIVKLVERPTASLKLTKRERATLLATVPSMFAPFKGTPIFEDIESIRAKTLLSLKPEERAEMPQFMSSVIFVPDGGTKRYEQRSIDVMDAFQTGIERHRAVRYTYVTASSGREERDTFAPLAFGFYRNGIYVIGFRVGAGGKLERPVSLPIERFRDAKCEMGSRFVPPEDFDTAALFQGSVFGFHRDGERIERVVIEVKRARRAFALSRVWQDSQIVEELPNGRVRITLFLSDTSQVVSWMLGEWGRQAEIISPPSLRKQVLTEARAIADLYDPSTDKSA